MSPVCWFRLNAVQGWTLRWATYSNNGFEEGVSLTCSDELARWQKYAYGCSEIIFNPIRYWPTRSPLTKLFRAFLASNIPPHAKYGIMGYIFSYYAISLACTASLANYVLIGVFGTWDGWREAGGLTCHSDFGQLLWVHCDEATQADTSRQTVPAGTSSSSASCSSRGSQTW